MSRVLVAYFSATGATAKVAAELAEAENADCFEIRPRQPYTAEDLDYTKKDSRCNLEMADEKCRPEMDGRIDGMSGYDVVFLGFPIWWGVSRASWILSSMRTTSSGRRLFRSAHPE